MNYSIGILLIFTGFFFIYTGIRFRDKDAAGYLTRVRLLGACLLILIGGMALLVKPNIHS